MTTSQQLRNHLIRELMHTFRRKSNGDKMVRLALSGKEPFSAFRYVVETCLELHSDGRVQCAQFQASIPSASTSPSSYPSPTTSTMTTIPQLPNHLIRELMHILRLKNDGDAMVHLALSGKKNFPVFKYVVENHVLAYAKYSIISIHSAPIMSPSVFIKFLTEGSKDLAIRFVRELTVENRSSKQLPFEKITRLVIDFYIKPLTYIRIPWTDLEVLCIRRVRNDAYGDFLDDFANTSLPNLRKLEVGMTLEKLMTLAPSFSFPEDVVFKIDFTSNGLPDLVPLPTFPNVKHFKAKIRLLSQLTNDMLRELSLFINCFTGIKAAKLDFNCRHDEVSKELAGVVNFHEWLRNTNFSIPVEVDCKEFVNYTFYDGDIESVYEQLKSIGYEENSLPTKGRVMYSVPSKYITKKEYGNIKLVHRVKHTLAYDSDEYGWC